MDRIYHGRLWLVLGLMGLAAGCMVGPKYKRPETVADRAGHFVNASKPPAEVNEVNVPDEWWKRFGDPVTADLVTRALQQNYDLKVAAARVLESQAALGQARGPLLPSASYDLQGSRTKQFIPFLGSMPFPISNRYEAWTQGITATYMVDFFGGLRQTQRAAWADLLAADTSRQAVVHSVVASVIQARINIATLQRRLDIAQANIKSWERTLEVTENRYQQGLIGPVDVRLVRTNLEAVKAQEPGIRQSLATAVHALDVLLAQPPGASASLPPTLPDLPDLQAVPTGVPAALLDRRPDVKAAEFQLMAANARVGVSVAQLYPNLSLSANYGFSGNRWGDIWSPSATNEVYATVVNLSAPLFQGGALRAQVKAAKARFEELAAQYAGTVLRAMREVEDALVSEQLLQEQLEHTALQVREAEAAEELTRQRYEQGVENILTVLESQRQRRAAEEQLAITKGQIWIARVNLHLALGGDWTAAEPAPKQAAETGS
jgi:multidrug efflux system outer membrane protein